MSINRLLSEAIEKISINYGVRVDSVSVSYEKIEMLDGSLGTRIKSIGVEAKLVEPVNSGE